MSEKALTHGQKMQAFVERYSLFVWLPIADYPPSEWTVPGPAVLLAWPVTDGWDYGVGHGAIWDSDEPHAVAFTVGEWSVEPTHFAFLFPPK